MAAAAKRLPIPPRLLTSAQAAEYLGVSEGKLRDLVSTGRLAEARIDGCVRYDIRRLDRYVDGLGPDDEANPVDRFFGAR